jgi:hypothetical protein
VQTADEVHIVRQDETLNLPGVDSSVVVEVLKRRFERQAQMVQTLMEEMQAHVAFQALVGFPVPFRLEPG